MELSMAVTKDLLICADAATIPGKLFDQMFENV